MLKKITLAVAALAVSAAFLGAGSASAATLYKTTAKTTLVPVGATFTVAQPFWDASKGKDPTPEQLWEQRKVLGGGYSELVNDCANSSINFKVTQNSAGVFKAVPTAATFPTCVPYEQKWLNLELAPGQELSVTGSSVVNGTETAWLGTKLTLGWYHTLTLKSWLANFTGATGSPPAKGVFVQQPTAAKAPISLNLAEAPFSTPSGNYNVSAKFIFTGEAAAWSFG